MKKSIKYTIVLFFVGWLSSCNNLIELDLEPRDQYSDQAVWTDLSLMESYVNNIYYRLPHGHDGKISMAMLTDEAMRVADRGASNVTRSLISPSNYEVFNSQRLQQKMTWEWNYISIRACNVFLEQVEKNTYDNELLKDRLVGEIHFLRGYLYHILVNMYGGVPIITEAYGLDDDHLVPRNTYEESVDFIAEELDIAATFLPLYQDSDNIGRATKGAALALKSRVLLYAASDLYHDNSWAGGYSNPELIGYTNGDRQQYWAAAKKAAKEVIDLNVYELHNGNPSPGDDLVQNYLEVFLSQETSEDIFFRSFIAESQECSECYSPNLHNNPGGYHGHGSNNPIGNLVDDFEMSNGNKFDWNNPVHAKNPYENRDPRFYANILYDGAYWRPRPSDVVSLDPVGIISTGFYEQPDGTWLGGLDTRQSPVEGWNNSGTGYYIRKNIDPSVDGQFEVQEIPWRFIRYAEVLLNYAEASVELGEDAEALEYVNMIRNRAGLPNINTTGPELLESIRHERRIELMFEDQRYFDIRRWMIAPQVMSTNATGVNIQYHLGVDIPTYDVIEVQEREWNDHSYFMPIRMDEMNRNKNLIQNPLY